MNDRQGVLIALVIVCLIALIAVAALVTELLTR